MEGKTIKCPICGRPYKFMSHYAGDQSACPKCVAEAEENMGGRKEIDERSWIWQR